jgi:hypothetical protein
MFGLVAAIPPLRGECSRSANSRHFGRDDSVAGRYLGEKKNEPRFQNRTWAPTIVPLRGDMVEPVATIPPLRAADCVALRSG